MDEKQLQNKISFEKERRQRALLSLILHLFPLFIINEAAEAIFPKWPFLETRRTIIENELGEGYDGDLRYLQGAQKIF